MRTDGFFDVVLSRTSNCCSKPIPKRATEYSETEVESYSSPFKYCTNGKSQWGLPIGNVLDERLTIFGNLY